MTDQPLDALLAACEAATKGPWVVIPPEPYDGDDPDLEGSFYYPGGIEDANGDPVCTFGWNGGSATMFEAPGNPPFIATFNPVEVKALILRLQQAEGAAEHWKGLADEHALFDAETDLAFKDLDHQIADLTERATTAEAALTQRDEVIRGLREALTTYDAKSAECPLNDHILRKRIGDGPCPRCKATASEGCGVEVGASVTFIRTTREALFRTPAGEARTDSGLEWSTDKPPEVAGQYINVRTVTTFRWLPYKPDGARQMKKAGRWQQVRSEHGGWENADFPEGAEWTPNLPISRVSDSGLDGEGV